MRDDGQMILLSAIVACLFLLAITAYVASVSSVASDLSADSNGDVKLCQADLDNVLWAQSVSFEWYGTATTGYAWNQRYEAARDFRTRTAVTEADLESNLLRRGIACTFTYNDTAAREYLNAHHMPADDAESVGGIIVTRGNDSAVVTGCGYDMGLTDGASSYETTRVTVW